MAEAADLEAVAKLCASEAKRVGADPKKQAVLLRKVNGKTEMTLVSREDCCAAVGIAVPTQVKAGHIEVGIVGDVNAFLLEVPYGDEGGTAG